TPPSRPRGRWRCARPRRRRGWSCWSRSTRCRSWLPTISWAPFSAICRAGAAAFSGPRRTDRGAPASTRRCPSGSCATTRWTCDPSPTAAASSTVAISATSRCPHRSRGRCSTRPRHEPTILSAMAAGKGGKPSKEAKAAAKAARKQASKERRQQLWQAFQMQRKEDKLLLPLMIGALDGITVVFLAISLIFGISWFFLMPLGLLLGVLVAFIIFGRRVQANVYAKAEGQAGAAAWVLDNLQGKWRVSNG